MDIKPIRCNTRVEVGFQQIHVKDTGGVDICMSNETLARCFGEAVVAWNSTITIRTRVRAIHNLQSPSSFLLLSF